MSTRQSTADKPEVSKTKIALPGANTPSLSRTHSYRSIVKLLICLLNYSLNGNLD